ncbi:MAG: Mu-like prophage major head subunit gpT family protein [Sodalis sp. (in: enterobacteria)]|uniref:Mu-like prophage major head subunit gpT family protein n=1 Tax=Sodalis sp. (in: enterobacteria) TaxID=1898979 RepID=UPI003F3906A6
MGKTTYSNLGEKPLSAASLVEAQASYGEARKQLRQMKDKEGRPLNIMPNLLVVPPALDDVARTLIPPPNVWMTARLISTRAPPRCWSCPG